MPSTPSRSRARRKVLMFVEANGHVTQVMTSPAPAARDLTLGLIQANLICVKATNGGSSGRRCPMGQRKKLIFVSSADPRTDPEPIRRAYLWATTAAKEGLEAEVRLVGEAVRAAHPGEIKDFERIAALRQGILAGASGNFLVSL